MLVIPGLGKQRQEDHHYKFLGQPVYTAVQTSQSYRSKILHKEIWLGMVTILVALGRHKQKICRSLKPTCAM